MIVLAGHLKTDPDLVEELAATLRTLAGPTMQEDGCLNYHFAVDNRAEGTILVYERWRDEAALANHFTQPGVLALIGGWAGRIDTSRVTKFDTVNERGFMD